MPQALTDDVPGFGHIVAVGGEEPAKRGPAQGPAQKVAEPADKALADVADEPESESAEEREPAESEELEDAADEAGEAQAGAPDAAADAAKTAAPADQEVARIVEALPAIDRHVAAITEQARAITEQLRAISTDPLDYPNEAAYQRAVAKAALYEARINELYGAYQQATSVKARAQTDVWRQMSDAARRRYPDFDKVMGAAQFEPSPHLAQLIVSTPKGADVAYFLSKNPRIGAYLSQLPPTTAAMEIARIEANLTAPAKRPSNAPPPAPVTSGARSSVKPRKIETMSIRALSNALKREMYN